MFGLASIKVNVLGMEVIVGRAVRMMHDIITACASIIIRKLVTKTFSVHPYNIRSSPSEFYYKKTYKNEIQKNCPFKNGY